MKGDFSRLTFDPGHPFSRVLMQQGRVLVDADWNELNAVLLHYLRGLAADLVGPHGGPKEALGLKIGRSSEGGFAIGPGRYYVDGIEIELEARDAGQPSATYADQPYLPSPPDLPDAPFLAYLDVWERHVTSLEDDRIREKALGGPDTSSRGQVVWQIRAWPRPGEFFQGAQNCSNFQLDKFREALRGLPPRLRARARRPPDADADPCLARPDARYRGNENQLYRVEIHSPGDGTAASPPTFKWSRENGSVVARWLETRGRDIVVDAVRDSVRGFAPGDWVELIDDGAELRGEPGTLALLARVEGQVLTIDPAAVFGEVAVDPSTLVNPKVRRWDHREVGDIELHRGAVPVGEASGDDGWVALEDGIEVQFQTPPAGRKFSYRTGDYWLIPARVATGDVEWPRDSEDATRPAALTPHGIDHHYAPLAVVVAGAGNPTDLRHSWDYLAKC